ncbi:MAG: FemAB family XrtA/PEP-CTERM system-associated protein [Candidatus Auribacterota bacterium]
MYKTGLLGEPKAVTSEAWNAFASSHAESCCYHQAQWRDVIQAAFGIMPYYIYAVDDKGSIAGVLPLFLSKSKLFGTFLTSIPFYNYGGILAKDQHAAQALLDKAESIALETGARHIELRHVGNIMPDLPTKTHKVRMVMPLPSTPEELWEGFKSKLRSQIKRAQKEGMTVKIGSLDLLDDFYRVFCVNMRDLGTPVWTKKIFHNVLSSFPDQAFICVIYFEGNPAAAGFLHGYKGYMEIPSASSLRKYNRLSPNMLLYWSVLEYACSKGYKYFDFGRSSVDAGTYKFKEQWGSEPQTLHWQYWLADGETLPEINPQNPKYRLLIGTWQKIPVWLANCIGPMVSRSLP